MKNSLKFYIDGEWVEPNTLKKLDVINPADESIAGTIALGNEEDVDKAVRAARKAFTTFSLTSVDDRISKNEDEVCDGDSSSVGAGFESFEEEEEDTNSSTASVTISNAAKRAQEKWK